MARSRFSPIPPAEVLLALTGFSVYVWLAAPGVTWMDSGQLGATAFHLGGAHPPGHPAHTLLGKLAALLPVGEIAFRLSLLSAAAMAAAIAGAYRLSRALLPDERVAPVIGAGLAMLSPLAIVNATRPEVYTPVAALLVWAAVATMEFRRQDRPAAHLALAAAGLCGLAAAFHPLIAFAAAVPLAVVIVASAGKRVLRLAPMAVGLAAFGALVYVHLVVRANAASVPPLMWGNPQDVGALLDVLRGKVYAGNFELAGAAGRFGELSALVGEGFGLGLVVAGGAGLAIGVAARWTGAGALLAVAVCVVAGAATQSAFNPDMPGYVLPALLLVVPGLASLTAAASRAVRATGERRHIVAGVVLLPVICLGVVGPSERIGDAGPRRGDDPLALWDETVAPLGPGPGVWLARSDASLFSMQYEHLVAGGRPDIAIASPELLRDEWFARHVDGMVPELYVPYIDDGVRGSIAERLVATAVQTGRPVGDDEPGFGGLRGVRVMAVGRGYWLTRPDGDPNVPAESVVAPPPRYSGAVGRRVAGRIGLVRGLYEAARGRLHTAALAAGGADRFDPGALEWLATATPSPERPALFSAVPRTTNVFIFEDWEARLFLDDLAWVAAIEIPAVGVDAARERRVHQAWRRLVAGRIPAGADELARLGQDAELGVVTVLARTGRRQLAEAQIRAVLERDGEQSETLLLLAFTKLGGGGVDRAELDAAETLMERAARLAPDSAEPLVQLGLLQARRGKIAAARSAWNRALALEPGRRDVQAMLSRLGAPR